METRCLICGNNEEIMMHGHYMCAQCGKIKDGDCCQGETEDAGTPNPEEDNKDNVV